MGWKMQTKHKRHLPWNPWMQTEFNTLLQWANTYFQTEKNLDVKGGCYRNTHKGTSKKKKNMFALSSSLRIPDPYFLLKNPRPLSPRAPLDFLSTCLGSDSQNHGQVLRSSLGLCWKWACRPELDKGGSEHMVRLSEISGAHQRESKSYQCGPVPSFLYVKVSSYRHS